MTELFGVSMNIIAGVSVALAALVVLAVASIAIRNPVMFKMGLRNIPRRRAQTVLIIIGLMLSTLIVTAAFSTGDTLSASITSEVYSTLGEADEVIFWDADKQSAPIDQQVVPLETVDEWERQLEGDSDIESLAPFLDENLPVVNLATSLNEPNAHVVAFRAEDQQALGGLVDTAGRPVTLGAGQIAVNERLAELIDAEPGQEVELFNRDQPLRLRVVAIVPNTLLGGTFQTERRQGAAVSFDVLADFIDRQGVASGVFASNTGDAYSGLERSDAATAKLEAVVGEGPYAVEAIKSDGVETAKFFGSIFTTFFVILGLFSIAAGVLLIFLVFIMLAAERQPEMGMARAVGARRVQIVESFLAEGMGYDLGSAVVGLFAGMAVTIAMVAVIRATVGEELGVNLQTTFTARSLATAFSLGLIATFLVIAIASWRASRLNIVAAIRDIPAAPTINPEAATGLGYLRAALNGVVAAALPLGVVIALLSVPAALPLAMLLLAVGTVSPWVYVLRGSNLARPAALRTADRAPAWPWIVGAVLAPLGVGVAVLAGYAAAMVLTRLLRDRRPQRVPIWLLVAGVAVPPLGLVLVALQDQRARVDWAAGLGFAMAVGGVASTFLGLQTDRIFTFMLGPSLLIVFVATVLRYFHVAERLSFTACGVAMLVFWYGAPTGVLDPVLGDEMTGGPEMFFLSGFAMVTAGTFLVVYNADVFLPIVASVGSRLGRLVPAIKTAVAYPLTSRFRTGMTIAMIALIMFALVMNATLNRNFVRLFINDETKGGFDIRAAVNPNNPMSDPAAFADAEPWADAVEAVGEVRFASPFEAEVENRDGLEDGDEVPEFLRWTVMGLDDGFIDAQALELDKLAAGIGSADEVWERMRTDPATAVLPASVFRPEEAEFDGAFGLEDFEDGFEPFTLRLRNPAGEETTVLVIAVMASSADQFYGGILMQRDAFLAAFPESKGQSVFFTVNGGAEADEVAKQMEAELLTASVDSLQALLDEQIRQANGFLLIFQGFMGLGLVVGIAALAVIAFRNVVERRQQIGMLRAIGYRRRMVALSFLFESGFTATAGVMLGFALGLSFAWLLFTQGALGEETEGTGFAVPWLELGGIIALALGSSLLMTIIPSRQAASVPVAEALRYE